METKEAKDFVFTPTEEPDQVWALSRASGETYRLDLKEFVCSCADFKFRRARGDRMCKHIRAACEAYGIEEKKTVAMVEREAVAITVSQEEMVQAISEELKEEMIKNYVYAVPDYEREYTDKQGRKRTTKKAGWIDLRATGVTDLAHMIADRYGPIGLGEFHFMETADKYIAWRDIKLGNFTATGFADCEKDREFAFRYLGKTANRNAYKAIVPRIFQDIFTERFREMMRQQLAKELPEAEKVLGKPIEKLTDGELALELKKLEEKKKPMGKAEKAEELKKKAEEAKEDLYGKPAPPQKPPQGQPEPAKPAPKPVRDPKTIRTINDLCRACFEDWGLQPKDVSRELGLGSLTDLAVPPSEAYLAIKAIRSPGELST